MRTSIIITCLAPVAPITVYDSFPRRAALIHKLVHCIEDQTSTLHILHNSIVNTDIALDNDTTSFYQRARSATLVSGRHLSSSVIIKSFLEEQHDEIDTESYVIEATELISEVRFDLRGQ